MGVLALRTPLLRVREGPALALVAAEPPELRAEPAPEVPLAGFWMAGFDAADPAHVARLDEDHRRMAQLGLRCVREDVDWAQCEDGRGHIELGVVLQAQAAARRHRLQVLWTLRGLPSGLAPDSGSLAPRLARFAAAVARALGPGDAGRPPIFTPLDAIGRWRGGTECGAAAALAAMDAITQVRPDARFLHVETLDPDTPAGSAWRAWDLFAGRVEPALGGHPRRLDLLGIRLPAWPADGNPAPRRRLRALLAEAWLRYHRPLLLLEPPSDGTDRTAWLHEVASEVRCAQAVGVPVRGLCLQPPWHVDRGQSSLPRRVEPELRRALARWQHVLPQPLPQGAVPQPRVLLAFSSLRWEHLRHRTRHLLQGLADAGRGWRVVLVEEPRQATRPRLERIACGPHLEVLVPWTPARENGFHSGPCLALQRLLCDWLAAQGIRRHTAWLATPMAWPLARALRPERVLYDCIDEMSGFANAPPELPQLEAELLAAADAVCAASTALAAARAPAAGERLQLLPNGVDVAFFRRGHGDLDAPVSRAEEEAALAAAPLWQAGGPQLGYAGAIDERIDLALLEQLADARPHWQFVLLGPVVGIDAATLPRRPNLHWLGTVPYRLLPPLMAHWQLALLPFVRSAATWRARPLKVLEALALGLPVVASPLPELCAWSAAGVTLTRHAPDGRALDAGAFLRACEAALAEAPAARTARLRAAQRVVRPAAWAAVVARLVPLLEPPVAPVDVPPPALSKTVPAQVQSAVLQ